MAKNRYISILGAPYNRNGLFDHEPFQIYIIGYDILNLSPTRENYSAKFGIFREIFQRPAMLFWNQRAHRVLRRNTLHYHTEKRTKTNSF